MTLLYPAVKKCIIGLLIVPILVMAQAPVNPFQQLLLYANLQPAQLAAEFPALGKIISRSDYTIDDINRWISTNPAEWQAFSQKPEIKKLNVAWATLGIQVPAPAKTFRHSFYQWYAASGISEEKRKQLFPHFPLPDLQNDPDKEEVIYESKVAAWQRLYPEEYERFLNTPELTALNPYYKGYYKLPYVPRFIGAEIGFEKPRKQNTGNEVMDEYNYQLKLRNWLFVFDPEKFNRLYGKDYKFPESFDANAYRESVIKMLNDQKNGVTTGQH
ncbi:MAG: hypothetical protein NZM35_04640 [Chitinophagales bacterium]|nr:hypothetical protein [Chitinophagales bacterium]MDW8418824.1 hypothetical protein [Chitinophagales bacterium]